MKRKMLLRLAALPFIAAMGALPAVTGCDVVAAAACPDFNAGASFGANLDIDADVKTFMQAAGNFQILGEAMATDVGDACAKIALATGGDKAKWDGTKGADYVNAACAEADATLTAALGNAKLVILVEGGQCKVSIKATADCNASCDVSGKCTPAQLEAKCEPGKIAGSCTGKCTGSCSADAGSIQCTGACDGNCTGTCAGACDGLCDGVATTAPGACDGTCDGRCSASCTGQCAGKCEVTDPSASCQGVCHGECDVEFKAPYCEGKFTPPECDIDADCQANCQASATAQAECTPPTIAITGSADLEALIKVLEETLPIFIVNTVNRGEGLVASVEALVTSGDKIAGKADLAADAAACATVAGIAAAEAALNIKASVTFSVQVSATASGSVN